jgi:hypothetical protein
MHMTEKEIIGIAAVVLGVAGYGFYMGQIYRRAIKPHMFTWIIWGIVMSIGFAVQYAEEAGPGAWNLGVGAAATILIAAASCFYGERKITRGDWVFFIGALSAIPAWLMARDPLWAVVIISLIDAAAFYPTFRKSWMKPREEGSVIYFNGAVQFSLSIAALEKITVTTALYPATIAVLNAGLVMMLLWRRRVLA